MNDKEIKTIEALRKFFKVSNIVFETQQSFTLALGNPITPNKMHQLHKIALKEIEKEAPDMYMIDKLLQQMENQADITKNQNK